MSAKPPRATDGRLHATPVVLARMVAGVATLSIPLVLTRRLTLADFVTYKQVFLLFQTLGNLLPLGMAQSLFFFIPREPGRARAFLAQTQLFLLCVAGVTGVALYALAPEIARGLQDPGLVDHRLGLALIVSLLVASIPLEPGLTSSGRLRATSASYFLTDVLRSAALVIPALRGGTLTVMFAGVAVLYGARVLISVALVLHQAGPWFEGDAFRRQVRYALPFGAAMLVAVPQRFAHQFVVSAFLGPAAFALYAVGCFQLPIVEMVYTPTCELLMVRAGRAERSEPGRATLREFRAAAVRLGYAFVPLALFCIFESRRFVLAAFGAKFLGATPVFRVTGLGILLFALPIEALLRARDETRYILRCSVLKILWTAPLLFMGLETLGMVGAASAQFASELLWKTFLLIRLRRLGVGHGSERLANVLPWRDWGRALAAAGLAGLATALLERALGLDHLPDGIVPHLLGLAVSAALFGLAYVAVLWMGGLRVREVLQTEGETAASH